MVGQIKAQNPGLWDFLILGHTSHMLELEMYGEVQLLRLAKPPVNAFDFDLLNEVTKAISSPLDGAAAMLITGSGSCFSAGLDTKMFHQLGPDQHEELDAKLAGVVDAFIYCPIPIAAAVNGHAIGIGAVLPAVADYRVGSHGNYQISLPEVKVGLVLPQRVHKVISRVIGSRRADRLIVEGLSLSADEALAWGFLDELVSGDELFATALGWCENLLALPRENMLANRAMARADMGEMLER